jgi:hypothetical protein
MSEEERKKQCQETKTAKPVMASFSLIFLNLLIMPIDIYL